MLQIDPQSETGWLPSIRHRSKRPAQGGRCAHSLAGATHRRPRAAGPMHALFCARRTLTRNLPRCQPRTRPAGVATILTAENVKDLGGLPCLFNLEVNPFKGPPYAILAHGGCGHVGDGRRIRGRRNHRSGRDAIGRLMSSGHSLPRWSVGVATREERARPQVARSCRQCAV